MRVSYFLLGAFIGASVRFVIVEHLKSYLKFPLGILLVNVIGSFLLGLILDSETKIAFALMGFSGAVTSWATLVIDLSEDFHSKKSFRAIVNLLCNYNLSVYAAWLAITITHD
jgi:CrcB protein